MDQPERIIEKSEEEEAGIHIKQTPKKRKRKKKKKLLHVQKEVGIQQTNDIQESYMNEKSQQEIF